MSALLENVSVVIPLGPGEAAQRELLDDLKPLSSEIITASAGTRAKSLNQGASKSQRNYLWFLHADSRVTQSNINALELAIKSKPNALHYFDLAFAGSGMFSLNAGGANIRSRLFKLPYGDQGFCVSKEVFNDLGGFPQQLPYGEDLLFVRVAKKNRIPINRIASKLVTSPRKYKQQGWLKLTLLHQKKMLQLLRFKL